MERHKGMNEWMHVCLDIGTGGYVFWTWGSSEQHSEGPHPCHVDEEVVSQPQTTGKLHQWLSWKTQVFTGKLFIFAVIA